MSRRVFISYEYDQDQEFVNGIRGMLANPNIDIDFYNESVIVPINSSNAGYIKQVIKQKIERASVILCIVGEDTHSSGWVDWEVKTAIDLGKEVVFMRRKLNLFSSMKQSLLGYSKITGIFSYSNFTSALQLSNAQNSIRRIHNWDIEWLKSL